MKAAIVLGVAVCCVAVCCGDDGRRDTGNSTGNSSSSSGDDMGATCAELSADTEACFDIFCAQKPSDTFCGCWTQGMNLDAMTCACRAYDPAEVCLFIDPGTYEPGSLDCTSFGDLIDAQCGP